MKGNLFLKRFAAYIIDLFVITILATGLVYLTFINPHYEKYKELSESYNKVVEDYYNKKINVEELNKKAKEMSYDLDKSGYVYTIGNIVIVFLYFGVFAYWTKGQTLGKKIMNIKIISHNDKKLKITNYLLRAFILNGIIINIITLIAICFKESIYLTIMGYGNNFNMILEMIILVCMLSNSEGRGLHDLIAGTKVIDLKNNLDAAQTVINDDKDEVKIIKPKNEKIEEI